MKKLIAVAAATIALAAGLAPVASADTKPEPTPSPVLPKFSDPACQAAVDDLSHQEALLVDALRTARETVTAQQGTIDRKDQIIARLRHRLHH